MENERGDSAFVIYSFVLSDAVGKMCFESLYRFRFVRLYCIIGNAKCKYKKFPFHKTICRTEPSNR